jgi:hypothetical protein
MPAGSTARATGAGLTVVRPVRVGGPTIGLESPAPAPLPHLVDDAVTAALSGLDVLEQNVPVVASHLRQGRTWEGNLGLASVMQITRTLVTLAATIAHLTGRSDDVEARLIGSREATATIQSLVASMVASQQQGDWTSLADTLQHGFLSALWQWRPVFESLRAGDPEPEPDPEPYGLAG